MTAVQNLRVLLKTLYSSAFGSRIVAVEDMSTPLVLTSIWSVKWGDMLVTLEKIHVHISCRNSDHPLHTFAHRTNTNTPNGLDAESSEASSRTTRALKNTPFLHPS